MIELINGESLDAMSKIDNESIDMIFCDLPYGTTRNDWDAIIPLGELWGQYNRIIKGNGAIVLTAANPFDKILASSNMKDYKYDWIWHKNKATGHLNSKRLPLKAHEYVLVFYKKPPTYNPQYTMGHKPMDIQNGNEGGSTIRLPRTVLDIPVINNDNPLKFHPTQKPVELAEYFIKTYSNENDTILDNCMGSGSTGIACLNTNRSFIGIEINEEYYVKAKNWIENYKIDNL